MTKSLEGLIVLVALIGAPARAAGGGNTQGTLIAGTGLDWQRGGTELQKLPKYPSVQRLNTPTTYNVNVAKIVLDRNGCIPISEFAAICEATASLLSSRAKPNQLCGHWLEGQRETKRVKMYVLAASPDGTGTFSFSSRSIYLGCGETDQTVPKVDWDDLGAIGKCMLWPEGGQAEFWPKKVDRGREFNACIRAVRADYCGNGTTHTKDGTTIDLYRSKVEHHEQREPPLTLEATWDDKGAICIIHPRYVELSPQCQARFSVVLSDPGKKEEEKDKYYYCDPSRLNDTTVTETIRQRMLKSSLLANDSRIQ